MENITIERVYEDITKAIELGAEYGGDLVGRYSMYLLTYGSLKVVSFLIALGFLFKSMRKAQKGKKDVEAMISIILFIIVCVAFVASLNGFKMIAQSFIPEIALLEKLSQ